MLGNRGDIVKHDPSEIPKRTRALSKKEWEKKADKLQREKEELQRRVRFLENDLEAERARSLETCDGLNKLNVYLWASLDQSRRNPAPTETPLWTILSPALTSKTLSQYWFGIEDFGAFHNEVSPYLNRSTYLASYQQPGELLTYLMVFLRKGFELVLMEKLIASYRSDATLKGTSVSTAMLYCLHASSFHRSAPKAETVGRNSSLASVYSYLACAHIRGIG